MRDSPRRTEVRRGCPVTNARRVEERRLLERWHRSGDHAAREELVRRLLPLARALARRYDGMGEPLEDLVQVAAIGVMKAVDRFDLDRGTSLRAYAERMADGELRHHVRDTGALLHVPRALHARILAVLRTAARLGQRSGGATPAAEIAAILELTPAEVLDALQAGSALEVGSLDHRPGGGGEGQGLSYAERLGEDDAGFELVEDRSVIDRAWRALHARERETLVLRLVDDLTYREIAERLGISVTHAVRLATRALERLQAVAHAADSR
jgi:RNA polymerase sigma-B factor